MTEELSQCLLLLTCVCVAGLSAGLSAEGGRAAPWGPAGWAEHPGAGGGALQGRHGGAAAAQRPAAEGLGGAPGPQRSLQRPAQQVRGRQAGAGNRHIYLNQFICRSWRALKTFNLALSKNTFLMVTVSDSLNSKWPDWTVSFSIELQAVVRWCTDSFQVCNRLISAQVQRERAAAEGAADGSHLAHQTERVSEEEPRGAAAAARKVIHIHT